MQEPRIKTLMPGEIYIGSIGDKNGDVHHVILLPGDAENLKWQDAIAWANSIGGDLPTRVEQAMLWANHKDQLKEDWYWSNETHHIDSGFSWCQHFRTGLQLNYHEFYELKARAVRRLPIEV